MGYLCAMKYLISIYPGGYSWDPIIGALTYKSVSVQFWVEGLVVLAWRASVAQAAFLQAFASRMLFSILSIRTFEEA